MGEAPHQIKRKAAGDDVDGAAPADGDPVAASSRVQTRGRVADSKVARPKKAREMGDHRIGPASLVNLAHRVEVALVRVENLGRNRAARAPRVAIAEDGVPVGIGAGHALARTDRNHVEMDRNHVEMDRNHVEMDRTRAGMDRIRAGGDKTRAGMDRTRAGMDRTRAGMDRIRAGEDRVRAGMDRIRAGGDRTRAGEDRVRAEGGRTQNEMNGSNAVTSTPI